MKETRTLPAMKAFCFRQRTFNTNLAVTPPRTPNCIEVYRLQDSSALGHQWHRLIIEFIRKGKEEKKAKQYGLSLRRFHVAKRLTASQNLFPNDMSPKVFINPLRWEKATSRHTSSLKHKECPPCRASPPHKVGQPNQQQMFFLLFRCWTPRRCVRL